MKGTLDWMSLLDNKAIRAEDNKNNKEDSDGAGDTALGIEGSKCDEILSGNPDN